MDPPKKVKYIQKQLFKPKQQKPSFNEEKQESKQELVEQKPKKVKFVQKSQVSKTTVINVKVQFLRKIGYKNLIQWLENPNHVYIGRQNHYVPGAVSSVWANPFKVDQYGRDGCIQKFKEYLLSSPKLTQDLKSLKGKVLGCWCAPQNCHGHVLATLADANN